MYESVCPSNCVGKKNGTFPRVSLCVCGVTVCAQTVFPFACVKTYGESVCRSRVPVCLWGEGEWIGGDGEN